MDATVYQAPSTIIGRGEIEFSISNGNTHISHLYQKQPIKILFPKVGIKEIKQGAVINTSGGLVGGDHISLGVKVKEGARGMVVAQSAEKVYRSIKAPSVIEIHALAEANTWLEYLPQETILFDGSRLTRRTIIEVHRGAQVLAGEILVFGRKGSGEHLNFGFLKDVWEIRDEDRLLWADTLLLQQNIREVMKHLACFDSMPVVATIIYISEDAPHQLSLARSLLNNKQESILTGVTEVNGILVARLMGKETLQLRDTFGKFWQEMRHHLGGLPGRMPRLWQI